MAHAYSTDSTERKLIPLLLASAAIALAFWTARVLERYHLTPPWYFSPSVDTMGYYGLLYWLFDRYLWRIPLFRWVGLVKVPNLSGRWTGVTTSSHNGSTETTIELRIRQTWRSIVVSGESPHSRSVSRSASLLTEDEVALSYEYQNEPKSVAVPTMHAHRGSVRLVLGEAELSLSGDYYSGRDRQTFGAIKVEKDPKA